MKTFLRSPDPDDGGGEDPSSSTPAPGAPKQSKSAAETAHGKKTAREIQLEKKVSTLENSIEEMTGELTESKKLIEAARKLPSRTAPAKNKSLLDDLNDFLGFGGEA